MPAIADPGFYTAYECADGSWAFKTGSGICKGLLTQSHAEQMAARTEKEDRYEAAHGTSIISRVLRKHFEMR